MDPATEFRPPSRRASNHAFPGAADSKIATPSSVRAAQEQSRFGVTMMFDTVGFHEIGLEQDGAFKSEFWRAAVSWFEV